MLHAAALLCKIAVVMTGRGAKSGYFTDFIQFQIVSCKFRNALRFDIPDIFRVSIVVFLFTGRLPEQSGIQDCQCCYNKKSGVLHNVKLNSPQTKSEEFNQPCGQYKSADTTCQIQAVFAGCFAGNFVPCIRMADNTHSGIVVQHAFQAGFGIIGTICYDYHS